MGAVCLSVVMLVLSVYSAVFFAFEGNKVDSIIPPTPPKDGANNTCPPSFARSYKHDCHVCPNAVPKLIVIVYNEDCLFNNCLH